MIQKVKNLLPRRWWMVIWWILVLLTIFFVSFQYSRIAHFPTGDDPAAHIWFVRTFSFSQILVSSAYPLPLIIFKFLHEIFKTDYPHLFTLTISGFLFFSSLCVGLLAKKITNSWLIAVVAALIFSVGGWAADGLRMGLLAETFGWGMLALSLYFLAGQNLIWTLVFSGLLALSHPFSFLVFVFIVVLYLLIDLLNKEPEKRLFAIRLGLIYASILVLAWFVERGLIMKFLHFVNPERVGWGERTLWQVLTTYNPRRSLTVLFALIGIIISVKNWSKLSIKAAYLLGFVALFLSLNQMFGVSFLVFRFFPYLDMTIAIFAAVGLWYFVQKIVDRRYQIIVLLVMVIPVLLPHYLGNGKGTYSQVHNASENNSMTPGDQQAIVWISNNVRIDELVMASHKRVIWIQALTKLAFLESDSLDPNRGTPYIYYSEVDRVPASIDINYKLVYDQQNVKIYKSKYYWQ